FKRIIKEICRLYFIYLKFTYKQKAIKFLRREV
ncbi:lipooligosaccharide biosynthesis glycosyltransferase, partial [Campylobacter coli]|nr:lipooligosaccharide biosynthesis glycosyltransferase [Campylobacter coli]EAI9303856.1 lipooligosaccharide biosynthesis glycosyltransferase [Campylobacter coli]